MAAMTSDSITPSIKYLCTPDSASTNYKCLYQVNATIVAAEVLATDFNGYIFKKSPALTVDTTPDSRCIATSFTHNSNDDDYRFSCAYLCGQ